VPEVAPRIDVFAGEVCASLPPTHKPSRTRRAMQEG
jgi:hypothetical protein